MFRGIEHRQAHALHAVPHRLRLVGLLLAERIEAPLATRQFVGIHIRLGRYGHDQLGELAVLIDRSRQRDILDIALEPIGTERL